MYILDKAWVRVSEGNLPPGAGVSWKSGCLDPHQSGTMSQTEKYDAIVIGAGQAGVPLSTR